jgi:dihydrofolate reductase
MKVILFMAVSFNGMIATPDYKEDFLSDRNWQEFVNIVHKHGCLIWGRKTYELVRKWSKSYLKPFEDITKIIVSGDTNLKLDDGFTLANSPHEALQLLQETGFKSTILTGGSAINTSFAKLGLIDEVILDIEGVVIGKGIPLFKPSDYQLQLKLLSSKKISDNIIQIRSSVIK